MHDIYDKQSAVRPPGGTEAEPDSARSERGPTAAATLSLPRPGSPARIPYSSSSSAPGAEDTRKPTSSSAKPALGPKKTSCPLPFPFPPLSHSNTSSTSLAPSTAEGKPIPLDNTTAAHRTSALQKLSSTYPSEGRRPRYAKSAGAQSSTYSQPVLVRTYSGPPPAQSSHSARHSCYRPPSGSRGGSRRIPLPAPSRQSTTNLSGRPTRPALSGITTQSDRPAGEAGSRASGLSMSKHKPRKSKGVLPLPLSWQWQSGRPDYDEFKLPPVEAFSFKSFMADMQSRDGEDDIGADLDRIAEICARSRYSLSNQYEVHVAPHGSGTSISGSAAPGHRRKTHSVGGGPTLQAFNSDDDESAAARSRGKRRSGARRKSVAYGTLETIMSSSRSSEEDKAKKKPAAELVGELRGRAARKKGDTSAAPGSKSASTSNNQPSQRGTQKGQQASPVPLVRKKSTSLATVIIDNRRSADKLEAAAALVSKPALPQTSNTNLGVRTTPDIQACDNSPPHSSPASSIKQVEVHLADDLPHRQGPAESREGPRASWGNWIPWRSPPSTEGNGASRSQDTLSQSLRQLLSSTDAAIGKGKAVAQG